MKAKKIIFGIPTNTSGGAEREITTLANEFANLGYNVCFANFDKDSCFYPLDSSIKVKKFDIGFGNAGKIRKLITSPIVEVRRYIAVKNYLKQEKPDVVIGFLKTAEMIFGLASLRLGIPFVTSILGDFGTYKGLLVVFRKWAYPKFRGVVCQTPQVKRSLDSEIRCKSVVISNPIAPEAVGGNNFLGKKRQKKVIAVGRLDAVKNFTLFIKSVGLLVDEHPEYMEYQFLIFGEGALRSNLQNEIDSAGLEKIIKLCGVVPNALAVNNNASLYVMCSDHEGFPNALVEAMANGIPCICTDFSSGAAKILIGENERGWLVKTGDSKQLSKNMHDALSNINEADRRAALAAEFVSQYSSKDVSKIWLSVIENDP